MPQTIRGSSAKILIADSSNGKLIYGGDALRDPCVLLDIAHDCIRFASEFIDAQASRCSSFGPYQQLAYDARSHAREQRSAGNESEAVVFETAAKWLENLVRSRPR